MFKNFKTAFLGEYIFDKEKEKLKGKVSGKIADGSSAEKAIAAAYVAYITEQENLRLSQDQLEDLIEKISKSLKRAKSNAKKFNSAD